MGLPDDYVSEMDALSSDQVEMVLAGRASGERAETRASALVDDLRRALPEEPSPEVAERHLAAMAAAAEEAGLTRSRRPGMRVLTRKRIGGLALAATFLLGGGLAAAVTLPDEADERALEAVGQGPEVAQEASAHGKAVAEVAQDPSLDGCEKGQAVAAVASSKAPEQPQGPEEDPCAQGEHEENGEGAGNGEGDEASAFGQQTAEEAQADGRGFGEQTASEAQQDGAGFGQGTAGEAGGGTPGGDAAQDGLETAEDSSGGAPEEIPSGPPEGAPGP
jgi:hypothetical protein